MNDEIFSDNGDGKMKPKIYLETSLFGFYIDEHEGIKHKDTVRVFEMIAEGNVEAYTSTHVISELRKAPERIFKRLYYPIEKYNITVLESNDEIRRMAELYVKEGIIPE